jgi:glycine dehydrogenase subunit 2
MKHNPKVHEDLARRPGFADIHPLQPPETVQGALAVMYDLERCLAEITGMDAATLAPAAGAQGELTGILMIKAYLAATGQSHRRKILVPDSAHGTNPATAAMAGFEVVTVASDRDGDTDMRALQAALDNDVAAMMLTLPNTLGIFDRDILKIAEMLHAKGALLYGDGASLNALVGRARFGDLGFDVVHLNLHKTFSTPHGGGGPGAGPVCVKGPLAPYLPTPSIEQTEGGYRMVRPEHSIGKVQAFHGNFGVLLRAYAYLRSLGAEGFREVSGNAVLNANYVRERLRGAYQLPYGRRAMHEVIASASKQRAKGVRAWDVAKRLIDYGFHPPTVYFPLIVEEAMLIEPTETESKEALDSFCEALLAIAREVDESPEVVKGAPHDTPVGRLDEATAARRPILRWQPRQD